MGKLSFVFFTGLMLLSTFLTAQTDIPAAKPLRVGVIGLVHDHVHWILGREKKGDIEVVGIVEPNRELAERYARRHGYDPGLVYSSMEEMIAAAQPEAVTAFNAIYDHLQVVEYCAPRGIHVMVEKPLAVSVEHAEKMIRLARENNILLLTNYETTWYGSHEKAYQLIHKEKMTGDIRKIVFHTGHQGPIEIGCSKEFLAWLTDPVLNGAGPLTDFGCYGANLATWLMKGAAPETVSCITQHIKPDLYPKVEDEATILLTYPQTQVIIQASWNWPYGRKDMIVYGKTGYVNCLNRTEMQVMETEKKGVGSLKADPLPAGLDDPFAYLAGMVRGKIKMQPYDLSSPENNELVVRILEAAKEAARTGKTVVWKTFYGK